MDKIYNLYVDKDDVKNIDKKIEKKLNNINIILKDKKNKDIIKYEGNLGSLINDIIKNNKGNIKNSKKLTKLVQKELKEKNI